MKQITPVAFSSRQMVERAGDFLVGNADIGIAMGQHFHTYPTAPTARDDGRWLSLLIDAMEEAARPEIRSFPCDAESVAALRAHLLRPATYAYCGSFSARTSARSPADGRVP